MFRPLAWTKTLSVAFSSILAITLVPVLMVIFIRGHLEAGIRKSLLALDAGVVSARSSLLLALPENDVAFQSDLSRRHFTARLAHWQPVHAATL